MKLAYPDIADMESDGWMIPDGRKLTKEEFPGLLEAVRKERIWIHRRFVVKARQNRLRLYILKALNPYRPNFELGDLVNFWE